MKLVVGLGNPGKRYVKNRHNVGFMVVDSLRFAVDSNAEWKVSEKGKLKYVWMRLGDEKVELVKPQTFVNNSGFSVSCVLRKHRDLKLTNTYVIHDDLDIKLGEYKIQFGKGPKEHKGLLSIYEKLGTKDFWHVRVGVDNSVSRVAYHGLRMTGEKYVLQDFTDEEKDIAQATTAKIVKEIMKDIAIDNLG